MKPILYPPEERDFESNGLGILSDALSCTVTWEGNGIFDLTMEYPMGGIHFEKITDRCIIMAIPTPYKEPQPFRIADIVKNMDGTVTITANHVAYDLQGKPLNPFSAGSAAQAVSGLNTNAEVETGFTFQTDKTTVAAFNVPLPTSIWSVLGGSDGSILDVYGGQYEFDRWTVKLHSQLGQDNGVVIRYGKNLLDLEQERNLSKLYTGVYPYWADSEGGNLVVCSPKIVPIAGNFNYTNILTLDLSAEWQEAPTPEQLKTRTERYIKDNKLGEPTVSITVSHEMLEQTDEYAGLSLLERCSVFDDVTVQFEKLGIDAKATIVSAETDVLLERYNRLEIGSVRANIVDTVVDQEQQIQQKPNSSDVQQAIKNTADRIIGAKGGSKVSIFDGEKTVGDMYLDTDSLETAKNIIVINHEGIAFSNAGASGPWTMAIGIDGTLANQWIKTWELDAVVVKTGILQSKDGKNFWNLDTGQIEMTGNFRTTNGNFFANLWAGVFKMGQNAGQKDNEFVGVSTSASDPNNGAGIITVWEWSNGSGTVKTIILGGKITTEVVTADEVRTDSVSVGGGGNIATLKSGEAFRLRSDDYGVKIGKYGTNLNNITKATITDANGGRYTVFVEA